MVRTLLFWVVTQHVVVNPNGRFATTYRSPSYVRNPKCFRFLNPEDGTNLYRETSVRNYQYSLRNNPTEGSSRLFRWQSLKSSTLIKYFVTSLMNVWVENFSYAWRWNSHCTSAMRELWSAVQCTIRNPLSDRLHTSPAILPSPTR
jgi:hypothetical protein